MRYEFNTHGLAHLLFTSWWDKLYDLYTVEAEVAVRGDARRACRKAWALVSETTPCVNSVFHCRYWGLKSSKYDSR